MEPDRKPNSIFIPSDQPLVFVDGETGEPVHLEQIEHKGQRGYLIDGSHISGKVKMPFMGSVG